MKIRIKDNSVRLRLTQSEVKQIATSHSAEAFIQFGPSKDETLWYVLIASEKEDIDARLTGNKIIIEVPQTTIESWANSNQVSIRHSKSINTNEALSILIEKDFKCLTDRPGEDEGDMFPHPEPEGKNC